MAQTAAAHAFLATSVSCCADIAVSSAVAPRLAGSMSFKRFVELGRVALITYGEDSGKLCTIIDVLDNNRVLVDGPKSITGVSRQAINLKRVQLTDLKIGAKHNATQKCARAPPPSLAPRRAAALLQQASQPQ